MTDARRDWESLARELIALDDRDALFDRLGDGDAYKSEDLERILSAIRDRLG